MSHQSCPSCALAHAHKQSSRATAVAPAANQRCSARVRRDIWVMAGEDSLQCLWSRETESDWPKAICKNETFLQVGSCINYRVPYLMIFIMFSCVAARFSHLSGTSGGSKAVKVFHHTDALRAGPARCTACRLCGRDTCEQREKCVVSCTGKLDGRVRPAA